MSDIYYTSDPHYFHRNIIKFCNRPFVDENEMNEVLIERTNSKVKSGDKLFMLGDIAFGKEKMKNLNWVLDRINCKNVTLIRGNHDSKDREELRKVFSGGVYDIFEQYVDNQKLVLCHYPLMVWNDSHHGSWHIHGHTHHQLYLNNEMFGNFGEEAKSQKRLDVGVDCPYTDFYPISYDEVKVLMNEISS